MNRETKKHMLSILLVIALFFGGIQIADTTAFSHLASANQRTSMFLTSSETTVLDICRSEELVRQSNVAKIAVNQIRYSSNPALDADKPQVQPVCLLTSSFDCEVFDSASTYSHRILLDYIHLKDGKSPQFS